MMGGEGEGMGVLPRSLDSIFNDIGDKMFNGEPMIPKGSFFVQPASSSDMKKQKKIVDELEAVVKDKKLKGSGKRRSIMTVPDSYLGGSLVTPAERDGDVIGEYLAFASFYEVYNEKVYDLLERPDKSGKRKDLTVKQDKRGTFIDKIRYVQIQKPSDALRVLEAGTFMKSD